MKIRWNNTSKTSATGNTYRTVSFYFQYPSLPEKQQHNKVANKRAAKIWVQWFKGYSWFSLEGCFWSESQEFPQTWADLSHTVGTNRLQRMDWDVGSRSLGFNAHCTSRENLPPLCLEWANGYHCGKQSVSVMQSASTPSLHFLEHDC